MSEHPNAARAREGFARFVQGDLPALLDLFADDAVYRARGERPDGRALDVEQALLVELEDGRWRHVRAQPLDQPAFDAFWS